jgi:PadR family transcriptional regulator, regulatory protein AphA
MTLVSLKHAILGFIDLEPATGYTLAQRFDGSTASFWSATQSQIYRELHELERNELVEHEVIPRPGKPSRKLYKLTQTGSHELSSWLTAPVELLQLRDPFMLKFVFAAQLPAAELDAALQRHSDELERRRDEYAARLAMPESFELARSPREALLWRLSIDSGLAFVEAQLRWTARARAALRGESDAPQTPKPKRKRTKS